MFPLVPPSKTASFAAFRMNIGAMPSPDLAVGAMLASKVRVIAHYNRAWTWPIYPSHTHIKHFKRG